MKIIKILIFLCLILAMPVSAQENIEEKVFKGRVIEILDQRQVPGDNGVSTRQQNLKIKILDGEMKGEEIVFEGISDFEVASANAYDVGDKVLVNYSQDIDGNENYYVIDYVRTNQIYILAFIFALAVIVVGRWKGLMSLISLVISFFVILKFIIPQILSGANPLLISIIGGIAILLVAVYLTQGLNKKSHFINISLILSFVLIGLLSFFFTNFLKLSGFESEETFYLINLAQATIDVRGLLLAGILIGVLGVLDDVIINQISIVEQIKYANPKLTSREVYKRSFKVGVDHISSMTNTLFFAYAGASLPLLILFNINQPPFIGFSQIISNEMIATEIARALIGSIGLIMAIPIANYLASYYLKTKEVKNVRER